MEQPIEKVAEYLERLNAFLAQTRAWCTARNLVLAETGVELNEEGLSRYQAPGLSISTVDGTLLATLKPIASAVIAAEGRVDLVGRITTHAFLFQTAHGPMISVRTNGKGERLQPMFRGINGDGWYWIEAVMRKARLVDEELFIDLLFDVSDHDVD